MKTVLLVVALLWSVALQAQQQRQARISSARTQKDTNTYSIPVVTVEDEASKRRDITPLRGVEGVGIYEAKKSEVILLKNMTVNTASNNARQVYAKVSGIHVWDGDGAGSQLSVGARGLSPNRTSTFNTRQNGYDIAADALGYPESYYTPPLDGVNRIEIVRGAGALQYGTQFGGMLNFVMQQPPKDVPIRGSAKQTVGSFGYAQTFLTVGGTAGDVSYTSFYQYKHSDGWRPNSVLNAHNAYAAMTYAPSSKLDLHAEYTLYRYVAQQPGGLTDAMFASDPHQSVRARNWFQASWNVAALSGTYRFSSMTEINTRFFLVRAGRDVVGILDPVTMADLGGPRQLLSDEYANMGNETRLMHRYTMLDCVSALLVGVRLYSGSTHRQQGDGTDGSDADFTFAHPNDLENSDYTFPGKNVAVFAENMFTITPDFSITPGLRYEYIDTRANGWYRLRSFDYAGNLVADEKFNENITRIRSFVFAGLGVSYRPSSTLEIYGNIAQNYRAITFNDLRVVNPNYVVDPGLRDESGYNADIGVRGSLLSALHFDASVFYLRYNDRIGTILKSDQAPLYLPYRYRTNVADSRTIGLELMISADVLHLDSSTSEASLVPFINASVLDARYINTSNTAIANKEVETVPPVLVRTGLTYSNGAFSVSAQYSYTGRQYSDATNAVYTSTAIVGIVPAYGVVDCSVRYTWKWLSIDAGINNVLDARYFSRRADTYPGPGIIPADARTIFLSVRATL